MNAGPQLPEVKDKRLARFRDWLRELDTHLKDVLPEGFTIEKYKRLVINAAAKSPDLLDCSQGTLYSCISQCAAFGLEPNTPLGHAWLIPLHDHGRLDCNLWLGYKGYFHLQRVGGNVKSQKAELVFQSEIDAGIFEYSTSPMKVTHGPWKPGLEKRIEMVKDGDAYVPSGNLVAAYCRVTGLDGAEAQDLLELHEIEQRRAKSRGRNHPSMPWVQNYGPMARKTVARSLFGRGEVRMTGRLANALEYERVIEDEAATPEEAHKHLAMPEVPRPPQIGEPQEFGERPEPPIAVTTEGGDTEQPSEPGLYDEPPSPPKRENPDQLYDQHGLPID